jgi:hypothetical protein
MIERPHKDFCGEVFGILSVAGSVVDVVVDAPNVSFVQFSKGGSIILCHLDKLAVFEFRVVAHEKRNTFR